MNVNVSCDELGDLSGYFSQKSLPLQHFARAPTASWAWHYLEAVLSSISLRAAGAADTVLNSKQRTAISRPMCHVNRHCRRINVTHCDCFSAALIGRATSIYMWERHKPVFCYVYYESSPFYHSLGEDPELVWTELLKSKKMHKPARFWAGKKTVVTCLLLKKITCNDVIWIYASCVQWKERNLYAESSLNPFLLKTHAVFSATLPSNTTARSIMYMNISEYHSVYDDN